jgi:hypothetical protein
MGTEKIEQTAKNYLTNMMETKIYVPLSSEDAKSI